MSRPRHTLIAYLADGNVIRKEWRVRSYLSTRRDGPATNEALRAYCNERQFDFAPGIERAIIARGTQIVARYLRSAMPTNDQERIIQRIIGKPEITFSRCTPQHNGDIVIERWVGGRQLPDTIVFRHPTPKELLYS